MNQEVNISPHHLDGIFAEITANIHDNKKNTLIYISIGCAVSSNDPDDIQRGYLQQFPPCIKRFRDLCRLEGENANIIFVLIDPVIKSPPRIIYDYDYEGEENVRGDVGFKETVITPIINKYEKATRDITIYSVKCRIETRIKGGHGDIRLVKILKPLAEACQKYQCCVIVNDFSGRYLVSLRRAMYSKENPDLADRCLVGLSFIGHCSPDLTKPEYMINISRSHSGISVMNPYKHHYDWRYFRDLYKSSVTINDKSLIIRMKQMFNLHTEGFFDIVLNFARMTMVERDTPGTINKTILKNMRLDTEDYYSLMHDGDPGFDEIGNVLKYFQCEMVKILMYVIGDEKTVRAKVDELFEISQDQQQDIYSRFDSIRKQIKSYVTMFFDNRIVQ